MKQATIKMEFAPDKMDVALHILQSLVERTRTEVGCVSCSVYKDTEKENQIILSQEWRSEEDLQRHLRSEEYRKVLLVLEMALEPPEIRFDTITGSGGVEVIEGARSIKKE